MNKIKIQKIRDALSDPISPLYGSDLVPLIADLIDENELLCSQEPCPKCGYGVTGACYGCEIKRLQNQLDNARKALRGLITIEGIQKKYDILVNQVIDMQCAIVGWQSLMDIESPNVYYRGEDGKDRKLSISEELITDLEWRIERAIPNKKP